MLRIYFEKLGYILGGVFTKSSGHTGHGIKIALMQFTGPQMAHRVFRMTVFSLAHLKKKL
jgi:hypothetical protein